MTENTETRQSTLRILFTDIQELIWNENDEKPLLRRLLDSGNRNTFSIVASEVGQAHVSLQDALGRPYGKHASLEEQIWDVWRLAHAAKHDHPELVNDIAIIFRFLVARSHRELNGNE